MTEQPKYNHLFVMIEDEPPYKTTIIHLVNKKICFLWGEKTMDFEKKFDEEGDKEEWGTDAYDYEKFLAQFNLEWGDLTPEELEYYKEKGIFKGRL